MNEEPTREFTGTKSFEERVFARFDAIEKRFDGVYARFDVIEIRLEKLESRSYDTKPIWERALTEISETRNEVGELSKRLGGLETKVDELRFDYVNLHSELVETQRDFKIKLTRRLDLLLEVFVDNRDEMRRADERLTRLESKLS